MVVMTSGMAHISGGMMAGGYIPSGWRRSEKPIDRGDHDRAGNAADGQDAGAGNRAAAHRPGAWKCRPWKKETNLLGAISRGTVDGLHLALNVGAMLITFIALLALLNAMMGGVHNWPHMAWFPESLQTVFGWIFAPVAWLIGVPWQDAAKIGNLLGTRMVINEFVAFGQLGLMKGSLDPRSFAIATFALCGFANFSSIGIQIGGIGALAPEQRTQLAKFGIRAMLAGTMANLMSASIVGILS